MSDLDFSLWELNIIKNAGLSKSHKQIADMLERPVAEIAAVMADMFPDTKTRQQLMDEKRQARPKKEKAPKVIKPKPPKPPAKQKVTEPSPEKVTRQQIESEWKARRGKLNREPKFVTRQVDYNQKEKLRIDRKTWIYIDKGADPEKAKQQFLKTYAKSLKLGE